MTQDYCLKCADEAEFDGLMLLTGLGVKSDDGVMPVSHEVLIDRIGPITIVTDAQADPPETKTYPEYHVNLRLLFEPTKKQAEALAAYVIEPSAPNYRVWL